MSCACRKSKQNASGEPEQASAEVAVKEAVEVDLPQCYECAKKHLARAQIFFEEYHTGYPDHIKNLMCSMRVAEKQIRSAYLAWNKVQAHMDMSANELLGREANKNKLSQAHVALACDIRNERVRLAEDPLYIPSFDRLLLSIQQLAYSFK